MAQTPEPTRTQTADEAGIFNVTLLKSGEARFVCLFAVGRGGDPLRHLPLLQRLAGQGGAVIAPHFERLPSLIPTKTELDLHIRRLETALERHARPGLPLVGVGHSIGTVALLALAGAAGETLTGERLIAGSAWKFSRLALLASPTGFFLRPGALDAVETPIRLWAGGRDSITPPAQALFLKQAMEGRVPVDVRIEDEAGHFTFMDEPPPQMPEPHPDRRAFLARLVDDIVSFIAQ